MSERARRALQWAATTATAVLAVVIPLIALVVEALAGPPSGGVAAAGAGAGSGGVGGLGATASPSDLGTLKDIATILGSVAVVFLAIGAMRQQQRNHKEAIDKLTLGQTHLEEKLEEKLDGLRESLGSLQLERVQRESKLSERLGRLETEVRGHTPYAGSDTGDPAAPATSPGGGRSGGRR